MTYFVAEQSPYSPKKEWVIMSTDLITSHFHPTIPYSLLPAIIMGLSYTSYLRMCRDKYGARLSGKNHKFVISYFPDNSRAKELANILNSRLTYIYTHSTK